MRVWIVSLLLLSTLAGCASDSSKENEVGQPAETPAETPEDPQPTPQPPAPPSTPPSEPENAAPVAKLTADYDRATVPIEVTFSFDGTDADGDALTWKLSLDGEELQSGDALPGEHKVLFEAAGNYTVTFLVSDGESDTEASIKFEGVAEAVAPRPAPVVFAGKLRPIVMGCIDTASPSSYVTGGQAQHFAITSNLWDAPYVLSPEAVAATWWLGEGLDDPIEFHDNSGIVPQETTSGHVCVDETAELVNVGTDEIEWQLVIQPLA